MDASLNALCQPFSWDHNLDVLRRVTTPGAFPLHASYGENEASFDIESLDLIAGGLPRRVRRLVIVWARAHEDELKENWRRARDHLPLNPIEPLP
jgi:hypothetical protein